jgi:hypothetical protein
MAGIEPWQIAVVAGFLALLAAAQFWIGRNRGQIVPRLRAGRAIEIVDVQAIGPDARLALVGVEGRRVMICLTKGAPGVFLSLPGATDKEEGGQ